MCAQRLSPRGLPPEVTMWWYLRGVPRLTFFHIPTIGWRRSRSAEEAINLTELGFEQLTFKYASSSEERGSGFLAQPVKDGVMLSRLLCNQQKVFQSPLNPHSEYQSHDSLMIGASRARRREESLLTGSTINRTC